MPFLDINLAKKTIKNVSIHKRKANHADNIKKYLKASKCETKTTKMQL